MIKILFVCLGNICRSPLAEGIFIHLVKKEGLQDHFIIDSAGTASYHTGSLADHRTRQVAMARGIDLVHCARTFTKKDFEDFDIILPMDESNLANVRRMQPKGSKARVMLMREFDHLAKGTAVPDPYYGDLSGFEDVHDILERSCSGLLEYCKAMPGFKLA